MCFSEYFKIEERVTQIEKELFALERLDIAKADIKIKQLSDEKAQLEKKMETLAQNIRAKIAAGRIDCV